jgi:hypothetical protein
LHNFPQAVSFNLPLDTIQEFPDLSKSCLNKYIINIINRTFFFYVPLRFAKCIKLTFASLEWKHWAKDRKNQLDDPSGPRTV